MKRFLKGVFILFTIGSLAVYLLASATPYINPTSFWPMTFLGLGFPVVAAGLLLIVFAWIFIKWKVAVLLFLVMLLTGYKNLSSTFALNYFSKFHTVKDTSNLRVVTWNVRYFDNCLKDAESPDAIRRRMLNFIKEIDADVLVLQDFYEYTSPVIYSNVKVLRDTLGFKNYYFSRDVSTDYSYGRVEQGVAIFSKFPIVDSGKVDYKALNIDESLAFADINFRNKKLRIYTTHLLSMNLYNGEEIKEEGKFLNVQQFSEGTSKFKPIKYYDQVHVKQAELVRSVVAKSPYPAILTGDFNSVPSSYVYHTIKGELKDAFAAKGRGVQSSYKALSPTLRIDYILLDEAFRVKQFSTPKLYLSDHFPVIADVTLGDK